MSGRTKNRWRRWAALLALAPALAGGAAAAQKGAKPTPVGRWKSTAYFGSGAQRTPVPRGKEQYLELHKDGSASLQFRIDTGVESVKGGWSVNEGTVAVTMAGKPFQNGTLSADGRQLTTTMDRRVDPRQPGTVWTREEAGAGKAGPAKH